MEHSGNKNQINVLQKLNIVNGNELKKKLKEKF